MDEAERAQLRAERKAARKKKQARAASRRYYQKYVIFFPTDTTDILTQCAEIVRDWLPRLKSVSGENGAHVWYFSGACPKLIPDLLSWLIALA